MADPEQPQGELSIAELSRRAGVDIAYGPIEALMPSLQVTTAHFRQRLTIPNAIRNLIIPQISIPQGVNYLSVLTLLLILMYVDPVVRDNAIIVCFGIRGGGTAFGIGRVQDKDYWESDEGKRYLETNYVNVYTVEAYKDLVASHLS